MNLLECVELVEETKENSKNALIEKGLEIDESFKLSQVDEKIAEIKAGGGEVELPFKIKEVDLYNESGSEIGRSSVNGGKIGVDWFETIKSITIEFDQEVRNGSLVLLMDNSDYYPYTTRPDSSTDTSVTYSGLSINMQSNLPIFYFLYYIDGKYHTIFKFSIYATGDF